MGVGFQIWPPVSFLTVTFLLRDCSSSGNGKAAESRNGHLAKPKSSISSKQLCMQVPMTSSVAITAMRVAWYSQRFCYDRFCL